MRVDRCRGEETAGSGECEEGGLEGGREWKNNVKGEEVDVELRKWERHGQKRKERQRK